MIADRLNKTFSALADPTRRAILARLSRGEVSVKDLAKPFKMSLPGISKHLKVLENAGLISKGRDAQWRPCKLEASPLNEASEWMDRYRHFWEARLDKLETYLQELQAKQKDKGTTVKRKQKQTKKKTKNSKMFKEKSHGTRNN